MSSSKIWQKSALLAYGAGLVMGFASGIFTSAFHLVVVLASWNSTTKTILLRFPAIFFECGRGLHRHSGQVALQRVDSECRRNKTLRPVSSDRKWHLPPHG